MTWSRKKCTTTKLCCTYVYTYTIKKSANYDVRFTLSIVFLGTLGRSKPERTRTALGNKLVMLDCPTSVFGGCGVISSLFLDLCPSISISIQRRVHIEPLHLPDVLDPRQPPRAVAVNQQWQHHVKQLQQEKHDANFHSDQPKRVFFGPHPKGIRQL